MTLEHMLTLGAGWETDGNAVQQGRLYAQTVCDRSISPCRLSVGSVMQRQTYKLIHTENRQTSTHLLYRHTQIQSDSCKIALVIIVFSLSGAALSELCCPERCRSNESRATIHETHEQETIWPQRALLTVTYTSHIRNPAGCLSTHSIDLKVFFLLQQKTVS